MIVEYQFELPTKEMRGQNEDPWQPSHHPKPQPLKNTMELQLDRSIQMRSGESKLVFIT